MDKKVYSVPVTVSCSTTIYILASSKEEAEEIAEGMDTYDIDMEIEHIASYYGPDYIYGEAREMENMCADECMNYEED